MILMLMLLGDDVKETRICQVGFGKRFCEGRCIGMFCCVFTIVICENTF